MRASFKPPAKPKFNRAHFTSLGLPKAKKMTTVELRDLRNSSSGLETIIAPTISFYSL